MRLYYNNPGKNKGKHELYKKFTEEWTGELVFGSSVTRLEKDHDQTGPGPKRPEIPGLQKTITMVQPSVHGHFEKSRTNQRLVWTSLDQSLW